MLKNMLKTQLFDNDSKIILFGAGEGGVLLGDLFKSKKIDITCYCDNYPKSNVLNNINILLPEKAAELYPDAIIIISILKVSLVDKIRKQAEVLWKNNEIYNFGDIWTNEFYSVENQREFCKIFHNKGLQPYYKRVESKEFRDVFWKEDSPFFQMFNYLDLTNVIELACGHGRHVEHYIDRAKEITLVDILPENIEFCKTRFSGNDKIKYYTNNGYNFKDLEDNKYTSLYTYDAMIHFEMIDIYYYLCDTFRILKKGSYALFHHSNNHNYKASFANETFAYMTTDLFNYMSIKAGFEIVEQQVIDWDNIKDICCITLLKKSDIY